MNTDHYQRAITSNPGKEAEEHFNWLVILHMNEENTNRAAAINAVRYELKQRSATLGESEQNRIQTMYSTDIEENIHIPATYTSLDSKDWITYDGKSVPSFATLNPKLVEIRLRNGSKIFVDSDNCDWKVLGTGYDIVAYRVCRNAHVNLAGSIPDVLTRENDESVWYAHTPRSKSLIPEPLKDFIKNNEDRVYIDIEYSEGDSDGKMDYRRDPVQLSWDDNNVPYNIVAWCISPLKWYENKT